MILIEMDQHGDQPLQYRLEKILDKYKVPYCRLVYTNDGRKTLNPEMDLVNFIEYCGLGLRNPPEFWGLYRDRSGGYGVWPELEECLIRLEIVTHTHDISKGLDYGLVKNIMKGMHDFEKLPHYKRGYGAGEGEEYSTIPGYEGIKGYYRLAETEKIKGNGGNECPFWFYHPDTGELYIGVYYLGAGDSCDDGQKYVVAPREIAEWFSEEE